MLMGAGAKAAADAARATIAAADFMVLDVGCICVLRRIVLASLTVLNEENGFVLHDKSLLICYYSHEALLSH